jgi:hypothetical protein
MNNSTNFYVTFNAYGTFFENIAQIKKNHRYASNDLDKMYIKILANLKEILSFII